jgi:outer membrane receptor protein involved in Fe transport
MNYDVGVFFMNWEDAQLVSSVGGLSAIVNAQGEVQVRGLEASLSGEPIDNLFVNASLDVIDSELGANEAALGGLEGENLANVPELTFALGADYRFGLWGEAQGSIGATFRYTGEFNTGYDGGGAIAPPLPNYTNDAYSQVDLRAGVEIGRVGWNFYVTNVTDEEAYQTVFPVAATYAQGIILRPRTFGLNARVNF